MTRRARARRNCEREHKREHEPAPVRVAASHPSVCSTLFPALGVYDDMKNTPLAFDATKECSKTLNWCF